VLAAWAELTHLTALANTHTYSRILAPIMKQIIKNNKFNFKPPKEKKLYILKGRIFFSLE